MNKKLIAVFLLLASSAFSKCLDHAEFRFDFLYWQTQNNGYAFGIDSQPSGTGFITDVLHPDFDYDPGFRVGIVGNTTYDNWHLGALWTYYHNRSSNSFSVQNGPNAQGILSLLSRGTSYGNGTSNYRLNHNLYQLFISKKIKTHKKLDLIVYLGPEGVSLYQKIRAFYTNAFDINVFSPATSIIHDDYWGVGPFVELDGIWKIGKILALVGKFSSSLLYGNTNMVLEANGINQTTGIEQFVNRIRDKSALLIPHLMLSGGIEFHRSFRKTVSATLRASWEANWYFDQWHVPLQGTQAGISLQTKALQLQGLTLSFILGF